MSLRSLTELKECLLSLDVTDVVMESTDMYWKPVMNILELGGLTIMAINARQPRQQDHEGHHDIMCVVCDTNNGYLLLGQISATYHTAGQEVSINRHCYHDAQSSLLHTQGRYGLSVVSKGSHGQQAQI